MFSSSYCIDSLCDTMIKMEEHRSSNSSIRLQLEESFCSNFVCCGLTLVDLHALLQHYEDVHIRIEEDDDELETSHFKQMQAGAATHASGARGAAVEDHDPSYGSSIATERHSSELFLSPGPPSGLHTDAFEPARMPTPDATAPSAAATAAAVTPAATSTHRHAHAPSFSPSQPSSLHRSKRRTLTIGIEPCDFRADSRNVSAFDNAVLRRIDPVDAPLTAGAAAYYHSPMTLLPSASHKRFRHSVQLSDAAPSSPMLPAHGHMKHLSYDDNELGALNASMATAEHTACSLFDCLTPTIAATAAAVAVAAPAVSFPLASASASGIARGSVGFLASIAREPALEQLYEMGGASGSYDSDRDDRASVHDSSCPSDRPYVCPLSGCDKSYKNANGLKYHTQHGHGSDGELIASATVRESDKPHRCSVVGCGKRYKNSNGLKYHTAHAHPHSARH